MQYDVVIVGGGPAGLSAALALGRGRKRVLLCDSGSPRNAAAVHVQNFVTRDGVPPKEFRRIAREQLAAYVNVETRDALVEEITRELGAFAVRAGNDTVTARRVLLCTGMIDELPDIEGFSELWGTSIFQCPYCHGWEVQDRRFAYLALNSETLTFPLLLRGWSSDVLLLTDGKVGIPDEVRSQLADASVGVEERPIARLVGRGGQLVGVELDDETVVERDVLFVHPPQRQVEVVRALGVELDDKGFVRIDGATRETSIGGIYAGGDLAPSAQGGQAAVLSAAAGMRAAAQLNHALTTELATAGAL